MISSYFSRLRYAPVPSDIEFPLKINEMLKIIRYCSRKMINLVGTLIAIREELFAIIRLHNSSTPIYN